VGSSASSEALVVISETTLGGSGRDSAAEEIPEFLEVRQKS
jgi:hypothetical protein